MTDARAQFEELLDAHLAGALSGEGARRFDALLEAHQELRAEAEAQRAMTAALRERLSAPADFASKARAMVHPAHVATHAPTKAQGPTTKAHLWTRRLAIAAVLLVGVFGAWRTWEFLKPGPRPYPDTGPRRTLEAAYYETIASGFEPAWICRNDQEFLDNVDQSLGEKFLIDQSDANVRVLGLAYANTISRWTVLILSYVNDQPVIVFADRALADRSLDEPSSDALKLHKRELGDVVLYELSPFDEPMILPRIYDVPEDVTAPPA